MFSSGATSVDDHQSAAALPVDEAAETLLKPFSSSLAAGDQQHFNSLSAADQQQLNDSVQTSSSIPSQEISVDDRRKLLRLSLKKKRRKLPNLVSVVDTEYVRQVQNQRNTRIALILFAFLLAAAILAIIFVPLEMAARSAASRRTNLTQRSAMSQQKDTPNPLTLEPSPDPDWWRKEPIYQIYPRSFMDSSGDGTGDLKGIISKLDYLEQIGIRAVWLSPIYKSPMADFGYDVSDFRDIDPIFGNLGDFDQLLKAMHRKRMYLIMDFIPNHTSDRHPWFLESAKSKNGKYADYYVWKDGTKTKPPNNWIGVFGNSSWTWHEQRKQWYLHQFLPDQPDLNYRNPAVRREMEQILEFWVERGVDGFRVDAVNHIFEDSKLRDEPKNVNKPKSTKPNQYDYLNHVHTKDQPENYDVIRGWSQLLAQLSQKWKRKVFMMTEAYTSLENQVRYYEAGVDFPFNFVLMDLNQATTAKDLRDKVGAYFKVLKEGMQPNFVLSNHDNSRVCSRLGGKHYADVANMLLLLLPGTPTVYYGDELGMTDVNVTFAQAKDPRGLDLGPHRFQTLGRDPERSPMQWSSDANAGFSVAEPWLPVSRDYKSVNVDTQLASDDSPLSLFRQLLQLRRQADSVFAYPNTTNIRLLDLNEGNLFCFVRHENSKVETEISRIRRKSRRQQSSVSSSTNIAAGGKSYVVLLNIGSDGDQCSLAALKRYFGDGAPTVVLSSGNLKLKPGAKVDVEKLTLSDAQGLVLLYTAQEPETVAKKRART